MTVGARDRDLPEKHRADKVRPWKRPIGGVCPETPTLLQHLAQRRGFIANTHNGVALKLQRMLWLRIKLSSQQHSRNNEHP